MSSQHENFDTCMIRSEMTMKCFFIAEYERATEIRKIAVYRFSISLLVPELQRFEDG